MGQHGTITFSRCWAPSLFFLTHCRYPIIVGAPCGEVVKARPLGVVHREWWTIRAECLGCQQGSPQQFLQKLFPMVAMASVDHPDQPLTHQQYVSFPSLHPSVNPSLHQSEPLAVPSVGDLGLSGDPREPSAPFPFSASTGRLLFEEAPLVP